MISPRFLFRFAAPCRKLKPLWPPAGPLHACYRLPAPAELGDEPSYADVRAAWSEEGLRFTLRVSGKRHPPRCRETHPDESDGFHLLIDTRNRHDVHRATRFCHEFVFLPAGAGRRLDEPVVLQVRINRAREDAPRAPQSALAVKAERRIDGYLLECFVAAAALTGFDPQEHRQLGFHYWIQDHELGLTTWCAPRELPHFDNPTLWGTLELVD
ncbi:MAG: hypothetical protein K6T86_02690 [Pirellulales bacterium]|nr:hypothetical protein [Pirellulales bacterium]